MEYADADSIQLSQEEAIAAAYTDFNFFAGIVLPEVVTLRFPPFYLAIFELLKSAQMREKDFSKYALGIPRGFAKTLFIKLFIAWSIANSDKKFPLIVCKKEKLAADSLADICDVLDSDNYRAMYGNWRAELTTDNATQKVFKFKGRNIVLSAAGADSAVRGIQVKYSRPDFILFDDFQSKENAESKAESLKAWTSFNANFMELKSPGGCNFAYIGNMYPTEDCILYKLRRLGAWQSFISGALLEDGTSLWPELYSAEQLLQEYKDAIAAGTEAVFLSEKLNQESLGQILNFNIEEVEPFESASDVPTHAFIIIDPKTEKATADQQVIAAFKVYSNVPIAYNIDVATRTEDETIKDAIMLAVRENIGVIFVEAVAYQFQLVVRMRNKINEMGITGMQIIDFYPPKTSKNSRILTMLKDVKAKAVGYTRAVKDPIIKQTVKFNPYKTNNVDDILDVLSSARRLFELHKGRTVLPDLEFYDGQVRPEVVEENLC